MRLKTDIWIKALIHRAQAGGAMATVAHKGDLQAGAVYVRVSTLDGKGALLCPMMGMDGQRVWHYILPAGTEDEQVEEKLGRERQRDPDAWVVEIEDRKGRHFINETIETREG